MISISTILMCLAWPQIHKRTRGPWHPREKLCWSSIHNLEIPKIDFVFTRVKVNFSNPSSLRYTLINNIPVLRIRIKLNLSPPHPLSQKSLSGSFDHKLILGFILNSVINLNNGFTRRELRNDEKSIWELSSGHSLDRWRTYKTEHLNFRQCLGSGIRWICKILASWIRIHGSRFKVQVIKEILQKNVNFQNPNLNYWKKEI